MQLSRLPTRVAPPYASKPDYKAQLKRCVKQIAELQRTLYAERRSALLVILQAPDAGGKDSAVRHVFSGVNPQGCRVHSFGPPSEQELRHDFLWRTAMALPERGTIGVFNRSYYEEVVTVRVHPDLLRREGFAARGRHDVWERRFGAIRAHEKHLCSEGTQVLKIFLHLSKEEQRRRFLRRLSRPDKRWKLSAADIADRALWDDYAAAYEACLKATSTDEAPWFVVPADDKRTAHLFIAELVLDALRGLKPVVPEVSGEAAQTFERLRRELEAEVED